MQGNAVGERNHAQEAFEFRNPYPMSDTSILGLRFTFQGRSNGSLAPLDPDVGTLGQYIVPEIVGHRMHGDMRGWQEITNGRWGCR